MEDRRISAKSRAEQLGISCERVGSFSHEDLDMRKLSAKCIPKCPNTDQKRQRCQLSEQISECFRRNPNDFLSRLVVMEEMWLCHYDPVIKEQSMVRRHSGLPSPQKIPSSEIRWKSSRLDCLGSTRHPPHWLSSKGPNYQRGVLFISAGANEGHFEGKTQAAGRSPRGRGGVLFLHYNALAHRLLATQKKLAYMGFQCLDHPPYSPHLAPSDYHLFSGWKKTIESSPFFFRRGSHCCRGDLIGRRAFWIFFWVAFKR